MGGVAFHRRGEGPALVLLHGVGLRAESWLAQIDALGSECSVLAPDLPGLGESECLPLAEPSVEDYTDRVADLLAAEIGGPACVAGHSMGALIALDLAIRHPQRCCAVAALSAVYRRTDDARRAVRERAASLADAPPDVVAAPVARWFGASPSGADADAAAACRRWLLGSDRVGYSAAYRAFAEADGPPEGGLAELRVPALFVTGSRDANSTPGMSRRMAELAPTGRAVTLEGAGHMVPMTHPDAISAMLRELVGSAGSAPVARDGTEV